MARVVLSALITDIRGKLGGSVFGNWKGIPYLRQLASHVTNPESARQQLVRNFLVSNARKWKDLTPEQRAQWEEYADSLHIPNNDDENVGPEGIIPPVGRIQSGFNAYIGTNLHLETGGRPHTDIAPLDQPAATKPKTDLVYGATHTGAKIDFDIWIEENYPGYQTFAQIWIKGWWKGSHAQNIIQPYPEIEAPPGLATPISITHINQNGQLVLFSSLALPVQVFVQCRTVANNGKVSLNDQLFLVKVTT